MRVKTALELSAFLGFITLAACGTIDDRPVNSGSESGAIKTSAAPSTQAAVAPIPEGPFSGEDLFRGLYFARGPVADRMADVFGVITAKRDKRITEVIKAHPPTGEALDTALAKAADRLRAAGMAPDKLQDVISRARQLATATPDERKLLVENAHRELMEFVLAEVKAKSRDFFERFGREMQSGEEPRVDAALHEASLRMVEALMAVMGKKGAAGRPPVSTETNYDVDTVVDLATLDLTVAQLYDATINNVAVQDYLVELYNVLVYYDIYFAVNQVIWAVAAVGAVLVGGWYVAIELFAVLIVYLPYGDEPLPAMPHMPRAKDTSGLAPDTRLRDEVLVEIMTARLSQLPR